ncbi:N-acetylmuramoyl-L-alanine amidase [Flammeovirga sp. EKP202]|uniref:golvesin C-terminal-like domain-containing protein n=1 Tax=Flammeovirga sp. EKP202 TaxID=2770592 RepID=UPI00165FE895|nr:N-acetylmuramoyl-L-alanine amidase [Flammeovirga sp. EKP202]MBD0405026.1 N-acetylmuramoyl-L-alanine amidase [Flammeovirga sp. EKP202]
MNKLLLTIFLSITFLTIVNGQSIQQIQNSFNQYLEKAKSGEYAFQPDSSAVLDTLSFSKKNKKIYYFLSKHWEYTPIRVDDLSSIEKKVREHLGESYNRYDLIFFVGQSKSASFSKLAKKNKWPVIPKNYLKDLVPNFFRGTHSLDKDRRIVKNHANAPIHVKRVDRKEEELIQNGLYGNHLAIWNSHGLYYEKSLKRWEWQRARLFQTVEDLLPTAFVLPYLAPMLENAGANVYIPRERGTQSKSFVVDNDGEREGYVEGENVVAGDVGFEHKLFYNDHENPFELGTSRKVKSTNNKNDIAFTWKTPKEIKGEYAVYVSYANHDLSVEDAHYFVQHKKQKTAFVVNQKIAPKTWVYLGTFHFDGSEGEGVYLSSYSKTKGRYITADAVRFGGGTGNIVREGSSSLRARYTEGARYNLQYSGAPEWVYSPNEGENDYKDDYQSRGEWVNWLIGAPLALNPKIENAGLGVPIDLALALHTDAGVSKSDTTIGTLAIYSTTNMDKNIQFEDGQSRLTSRDLADIIQTQIVEDARILHDSIWNRRSLWDRRYSEAVYPDVPTVLIELLSHQNFKDMWFALDPVFRFDVSRSIYKGILKYMAFQENRKYVVQPLPPTHFSVAIKENGALIKWKPQQDPIETSADPTFYKLYTNFDNQGWDNGQIINDSSVILPIQKEHFYSFKVTAVNSGGESFPTDELSMADFGNEPILVVNAFDRISSPTFIDTESYKGFNHLDHGVADQKDLSYVGAQYDFNPNSPWVDDDAPGFGASFGNKETTIIKGNTFNYPGIHGNAMYYLKQSFVSCNQTALEEGEIQFEDYFAVDIVLGEQKDLNFSQWGKKTEFKLLSLGLRNKIEAYLKQGGNLLISGAYLGSSLFYEEDGIPKGRKHPDVLFGKNVLHLVGRTDHADVVGNVKSVDKAFQSLNGVQYSKSDDDDIYKVESPDALEPWGKGGNQICRYTSNQKGAGISYNNGNKKIVALGFPFETILSEQKRIEVMEEFLIFFKEK